MSKLKGRNRINRWHCAHIQLQLYFLTEEYNITHTKTFSTTYWTEKKHQQNHHQNVTYTIISAQHTVLTALLCIFSCTFLKHLKANFLYLIVKSSSISTHTQIIREIWHQITKLFFQCCYQSCDWMKRELIIIGQHIKRLYSKEHCYPEGSQNWTMNRLDT